MKPIRPFKSWVVLIGITAIALLLITASMVPSMVWGFNPLTFEDPGSEETTKETIIKETIVKEDKNESICPRTRMDNACMTCHTNDWRLKEVPWDADLIYPNGLKFYKNEQGGITGYYVLTLVLSDSLKKALDYCDSHDVNFLTIEIMCWGGGSMEMWRSVGLMNAWEAKGGIIETRLHGLAASAGFLIMAAGSKDHRFVSEHAELMWHEVQAMEWPEITNPTDTEKKAAIYRHLQDNANSYLAERCNLTKAELDAKVRDLEFWITGKEAVEYGFADGFIGQ